MPTGQTATDGRFYVEVVGDELDGQTHEVGEDGLLLGRDPDCDLVFGSLEVSRRHAYIYPHGDSCFVKDLGSRNGLLVNGRPAREKRLHARDVVDIGPSRLFIHAEGQADQAGPFDEDPSDDPGEDAGRRGAQRSFLSERHPLASACLVFGALSCLHWGFGAGAIVLGLIALWELRLQADEPGRVLAFGGLALGIVGLVATLWLASAEPAAVEAAAGPDVKAECRARLQKLARAVRDYRDAHGGIWPPSLQSLTQADLLTEADLSCPAAAAGAGEQSRYIFLSGLGQAANPGLDIIACDASIDLHGGEGGWVLRADGRTEWRSGEGFRALLDALAAAGLGAPASPEPTGAPR